MSGGNGIEATGLVKYDAMQRAIVEARSVDEIKSIRDKAVALEKYAALSRNVEAERRCAQIRIQAMTKGGQLAKQMLREQGGPTRGTKRNGKGSVVSKSERRTLSDLGLSKNESSEWQQLAQAPEKVAEYLANEPDVPTTCGALAAVSPTKRPKTKPEPPPLPFSEASLFVCGRLGELDRAVIVPDAIIAGCDAYLRRKFIEHLDNVLPLLHQLRDLL